MNRYQLSSAIGCIMLALVFSFGSTSAQSTNPVLNTLDQFEDKVDMLQARVDQAIAAYNSLMTQMAVDPNSCTNNQICALQSAVAQFNGPLNVMRVKSQQLGFSGLSFETGAVSTVRYQIEQLLDGTSVTNSSFSMGSLTTIGTELDEMNTLIDGGIRREIQQIRQNL